MELVIKWTKEDIEKKLRDELRRSGFRPIETEEGKNGNKGTFQWSSKPFTVRVRAEPDPDVIFEPLEAESKIENKAETETDVDVADVDIPENSPFLPPGTAAAINKAIKTEKEGKKIQRRLMAGESNERPG